MYYPYFVFYNLSLVELPSYINVPQITVKIFYIFRWKSFKVNFIVGVLLRVPAASLFSNDLILLFNDNLEVWNTTAFEFV